MTTPISGQTTGVRDVTRHGDGRRVVHQRQEWDVDLAEPVDMFAGWLTVTCPARVERLGSFLGAMVGEKSHRTFDAVDAEELLVAAPRLAAMIEAADRPVPDHLNAAEARRAAKNREKVRSENARMARELISRIWEDRRLRIGGRDLKCGKPTMAAWSPEALAVVLEVQDGAPCQRNGEPWKNALEQEHVVPAAALAKIVAEMAKDDRASPDDVADMLRRCARQVIVRKYQKDDTEKGIRRDQPTRDMHPYMVKKLIHHFAGDERLDDDTLFTVMWSRYLDPKMRGCEELAMRWELDELRTVPEALAGTTY